METWLGWTFSGSGGGITVSSTLPATAGSAALNDSTHVLTVASDTGYTQFTGSFTAWDTTPAAFGFGSITDAVAGQEYCWSTPVTVADTNWPATVSSTADSYKINGATSTATSIALEDTFTPCMVASSTAGATVSGNVTVGGVAGYPAFSVTTAVTGGFVGNNTISGATANNVSNGINQGLSKSFVATSTGPVAYIHTYVIGETGNANAAIHDSDSNKIADGTLTAVSSASQTRVDIALDTPITVISGQSYTLAYGDATDSSGWSGYRATLINANTSILLPMSVGNTMPSSTPTGGTLSPHYTYVLWADNCATGCP